MTRGAGDALPALNEIVGLPHSAPPEELGHASEKRFETLFRQASDGDPQAQGELVRLRLAYLNWAYAGKGQPPDPNATCWNGGLTQ